MADIVLVSDSLTKQIGKTRNLFESSTIEEQLSRQLTKSRVLLQTLTIDEVQSRTLAKSRILSPTETVSIGESLNKVVARQVSKSITETVDITDEDLAAARTKARLIEETTITVADAMTAYKNGVELVPGAQPTETPTPQNILGTRERAIRIPRRPPRPILLEPDFKNRIIAPLKVLAFAQGHNRIQTQIILLQRVQLATSNVRVQTIGPQLIQTPIKAQQRLEKIQSGLRLTDRTTLKHQTARANIRLSQEYQAIESLRPIDAVKVDKLTRLATLAMMLESL